MHGDDVLTLPLRVYGGISRAELLKTLWIPVTLASDLRLVGNHAVALIDLAGEYAVMEQKLPIVPWTTLSGAWIEFIGVANIVNMRVQLDIDYAHDNELYNVHTNSVVFQVNTTLNTINSMVITALLPALGSNDVLGVRCSYHVGPPATNVYILGLVLGWV